MTHLVRGEILELDDEVREYDRHLVHELLHELVHLRLRHAWLAQAEIKRVFQESLVVSSDVDTDGDGGSGADSVTHMSVWLHGETDWNVPSTSNVERQLAD